MMVQIDLESTTCEARVMFPKSRISLQRLNTQATLNQCMFSMTLLKPFKDFIWSESMSDLIDWDDIMLAPGTTQLSWK